MRGVIEERRKQKRLMLINKIIKTLFLLIISWAIIAPVIMYIWGKKKL